MGFEKYELPPKWNSPPKGEPSSSFRGEESANVIYEVVGKTLSQWESLESANIKLFQILCETKSLAPCRAYGALDSAYARHVALKYAAKEFFYLRNKDGNKSKIELKDLDKELKDLDELIKIYKKASEYRNEIAHGQVIQPHGYGYFLCAPSYCSKRRKKMPARPQELWGLGSSYFYRKREIDNICLRFEQICKSIMIFALYLNEKYQIIENKEIHP